MREAYDQKNVQKAIKKGLFRFRQRGISVPDTRSQEMTPPTMRQPEKGEPAAYLGHIDGMGSRGIFIVLPQIPRGVDLGMGVVNDENGIVQFFYGRYSKKRMREVKDIFFERFGHMVETSLAHAATILEKAYGQNEQLVGDASRDYLQLRPWILDNVPLLDRSVVYDFIPPENVSEKILTDSQITKLFEHPLMASWIIDPEEIKPLVEKISEVRESRILVSEPQKLERINEVKTQRVAELFPDSRRSIIKNRLEEMAYVLFKQAEEEHALICLAAANTFNQKDSPLQVNPFLKFMLDRTLAFYADVAEDAAKSEEAKEDTSPLIIKP